MTVPGLDPGISRVIGRGTSPAPAHALTVHGIATHTVECCARSREVPPSAELPPDRPGFTVYGLAAHTVECGTPDLAAPLSADLSPLRTGFTVQGIAARTAAYRPSSHQAASARQPPAGVALAIGSTPLARRLPGNPSDILAPTAHNQWGARVNDGNATDQNHGGTGTIVPGAPPTPGRAAPSPPPN
jgi:hypothetical protein